MKNATKEASLLAAWRGNHVKAQLLARRNHRDKLGVAADALLCGRCTTTRKLLRCVDPAL